MNKKCIKLIYLADNRLSLNNAPVVNIIEMCNAFTKYGFLTTLVVPDCGFSINNLFKYHNVRNPFEIIKVKVPKALLTKLIPGLVTVFSFLSTSLLRRKEYNIAYTRTILIFFIISVLFKKICFIETHQFRYHNFLQTYIYRRLVKIGMKSNNGRMICISQELKKQWIGEGICEKSVYVAHDGVNIEKYKNIATKKDARNMLGFDLNKLLVCYTGSLLKSKGVDVLIRCANRIPEVSFVIVGGDKEQICELKNLSIKNNVIFIGHVPPKIIPLYQSAADILALPNTKGSLIDDITSPMKLFEYIASKRPIVATNIPSILEILRNNYNALISPYGDDFKLAKNINSIFLDPSLSEMIVRNAFRELKRYSWDSRVKFLSKLFEKSY